MPDSPDDRRKRPASAPRVSIVIPVYNQLELTRACLDSLARHTPPGWAEVIVVDNGSNDGTPAHLAARGDEIRVVRAHDNLGFARGCNLGAQAARAEHLLFLNNDTEAKPGWLEPLVDTVERDPRVGAVGSRLLFPDGTIQHAGVMLVDDRVLPDPLAARHVHYGAPAELADACVPRAYQALTAACLLVRREAFARAGGFDEGYWNGYEDVDLCFRLAEQGLSLVYEPASVLLHHESKSGEQRFAKVAENVARLHERWLGRIAPDAVLDAKGRFTWTDAARIRNRPRRAPIVPAPAGERVPGLVSIVVLTFNQLPVTQQCLAGLARFTPEPHELVLVDNGSSDGTVDWLREQVARPAGTAARVHLIENAANAGFARGCNQGIAAARGEYVLLLNNDVVLTEHWLAGLLDCHARTPRAGIVGPVTNEISGRQKIESADYADFDALPAFAAAWRERHRHERIPAARVVGFCMLMRRSLLDEIGGLDEAFGTGNFEDDDLCLRARLAGYEHAIAAQVFVHHHGSRSFTGNGIDPRAAMARNRARFDAKWRPRPGPPPEPRVLLLEALERARDLDASGRLREAVELSLEAIRIAPAENEPYLALAAMLVRGDAAHDALDVLQNLPSGLADPRARLLAGEARWAAGEPDAARRLVASIADEPDLRARAVYLEGLLAQARGERETAAARFNAALADDPGAGEPYSSLGALLWARDPGTQALELCERGLTLSPENPEVLERYCTAAKTLGLAARAAARLQETCGLHPVHRGLTFARIDLLLASSEPQAAMREIEDALEWFPLEDDFLRAALAVRARVGPRRIGGDRATGGTVSLCMIVRDEAASIVRCLRSVSALVDEMIVVDTGSTDATAEIATALGAQVLAFSWANDFAAARNAALAAAAGDWVLVLDADEALAACDLPALGAAVRGGAQDAAGYALTTRNYTTASHTAGWTANDGTYARDEAGTGWYPSRKVRLFRNDPRIRFESALHEVVDHALRRSGLAVRALAVPVHHYGPLDAERERAKAGAYYELAQQKLERAPEDPAALYELAVHAGVVAEHDEAIALWSRYVRLENAPRLALAWMNLGHAYLETNQLESSSKASREALARDPESRGAALNLSLCELCRGRYGETIAHAEALLARAPGYAPALGLLAAACVLAKDDARLARTCAALTAAGERPAAHLQAYAARVKRAGRGGDARRLTDAARGLWRETLAAEGLAASDAQVEMLLTEGADAEPERRSA